MARSTDLLTREIISTLPALYTHDGAPKEKVPVILKYFNPRGAGTWYITEGSALDDGGEYHALAECTLLQINGSLPLHDPRRKVWLQGPGGKRITDVVLYGLCCIQEAELGYVSLAELQSLVPSMRMERDMHYTGTLADAISYEESK